MRCEGVARWLDEGMSRSDEAHAVSHARGCPSCAAAIHAARALVDALLADAAMPTPAPPTDLVARVMSRVEAAGVAGKLEGTRAARNGKAAHQGEAVRAAKAGRRLPWWAVLATDPVSAVSLTLALGVGLAAAWRPDAVAEAAVATVTLPAKWLLSISAWDSATGLSHALGGELDPVARLGIVLAASPFLLWGAWALYRQVERALILFAGRRGV